MTGIDPWFLDQIQQIVDLESSSLDAPARSRRATLREAKRIGFSDARLGQLAGHGARPAVRARRQGRGHRARLQARRHLRGEFESHTPYLYSTYESENEASPTDRTKVHDPGQRAQPHRPGHRVRLLLLPRRVRVQGRGLRDDHGQLQPGDGLHRLRHLRPPVLRAADLRGRDEHRRAGEAGGRRHPVRRPDAAAPGAAAAPRRASRSWAPRPTPSTWPRTASASARCCTELGHPAAGERHRHLAGRGQGGGRAHRLPGAGAAVLRAGRARDGDRLRRHAASRSTCARR